MNDRLDQSAAEVSEWNMKIRKLREDISVAASALAESQRRRQEHVLSAAMGDDDAKSRLAEVLQADREAERQLEDLKLALPLAEIRLRESEAARKAAEAEIRRDERNRKAKERVAAASRIDQALSDFADAWSEYEALGRALYSVSDDYPNQIYLAENFDGLLRLSGALPHQPFFDLRHKHSFAQIGGGPRLAVAEATFWRIPLVEEVKAA
jgi:hypothetical protein